MGRWNLMPLVRPLIVLGILLALSVADHAYYYPRLPERIAVHFGAEGKGDRWESKAEAVDGMLRWAWFPLLVIGGGGLLCASFLFIFPSAVQLPNRDYWAAPEHRWEAAAAIVGFMLWFLDILLLLFLIVNHMTFAANLDPPPVVSETITVLLVVGLLTSVVVWLVFFIRRFHIFCTFP